MDLAAAATNPFLASPVLWVACAGLFFGAAVSRATMRTRNKRNPEHAWTRKWVFTCLFLSIAVILGLLAVFVPGAEKMRDVRLAWIAGGCAAGAFFALRFKKSMGIPIVVLILAVVIALGMFLQSVRAFTGETEIATVRVISADAASMRIEIVPRDGDAVFLTMKGTYFAPIVKVVIFNDLLVFMGARTWYRFEGMTSFNDDLRQQDSDYRFPHPMGISESLWKLFEENEARIPVAKTAQIEMTLKKAKEFARFSVRVQNDGGVEVVPLKE